jgi:hypothetical protein
MLPGMNSMRIRDIDRPTLLRLAAEADSDPRTVLAELRARRGERQPVRGRAGERIRAALIRHGLAGGSRK